MKQGIRGGSRICSLLAVLLLNSPAWAQSAAQPLPLELLHSCRPENPAAPAGALAGNAAAKTVLRRLGTGAVPEVRIIYLVPSDRTVHPAYVTALTSAVRHLQRWYQLQLGNTKTFSLHGPVVETYQTTHSAAWYQTNPNGAFFAQFYNNASQDAFASAGGGSFSDPNYVYAIYVDAASACGQCGGCGGAGVLVVGTNDLKGLVGQPTVNDCPADSISVQYPPCRYVGGLGHELGHAFGLPHPPGCEESQPTCDYSALMWTGYVSYPTTYLRPDERVVLNQSAFFRAQAPIDAPCFCGNLLAPPPVFVAPTPTDKQVFTVAAGQRLQFTVKAEDKSHLFGPLLPLSALMLPPGATLTPVITNDSVSASAFSWTPTSANVGTYNVLFDAVDREDAHVYTGVTILVQGAGTVCDPVANRPVANDDTFRTCGPLVIAPARLLANDTDPLGRPLQVVLLPQSQPGRGILTPNADGTFRFTPAPGFLGHVTFNYQVLVAGRPVVAGTSTGHYYEFVRAPGICWTAARDSAAARTYQGMGGYLATITSAAETDFLKRFAGRHWFGASDAAVEGEWRWKTGPEAGQLFWRGGPGGTATGYAKWSPGEPDDYKNQYRPQGEGYASFYGESGLWNDLDRCGTGGRVAGYVVEYGGLEACTPLLYAAGTVTIEVDGATAGRPVANPDSFTYGVKGLRLTDADLLRNDTDPLGRPLRVGSISAPSAGQFSIFRTGLTAGDITYSYSPSGFVGKATFTYLLQLAGPVLASPATGHYYEYVSAPGICWADAQKAAAARTYQGMGGYLATITSAAETDFLKRFAGRHWFGASDAAVEGEWRWKTGPEAGQLFWRGGPGGTAVGYARWSPGQPDDFKNQFRPGGENYGSFYGGSGLWNDLANCGEGGPVDGYLVEYGGLEACTPVLYSVGTVTINVGETASAPALTSSAKATAKPAARAGDQAGLEAAPNPNGGQFRLRVTATTDGPAQLDLYDLQGRRVKAVFEGSLRAGELRELSIEAPELAAGIYLVRLQSDQQVQHLRVAIQK